MKNKKMISLLLMIGLSTMLTARQANADFPIAADTSSHFGPVINGSIVVWSDDRNGGRDIYSYDLTTNTETQITSNLYYKDNPDMSGSIIVWDDYRNVHSDIYGYNISTSTEFQITTDANTQRSASISGSIVVWEDFRNGRSDIYGYNLDTNTEFPIIIDPTGDQSTPKISGSTVVWYDQRSPWTSNSIYGYDLATGTEFPINVDPTMKSWLKIDGSTVVWRDPRNGNYDLYGYDLTTNTEFQITFGNSVLDCAIDGSKIVWSEMVNGNRNIFGYDLDSQSPFSVTNTSAPYSRQGRPDISGSMVVFEDWRSGTKDIYGFSLLAGDEPENAFDVNNISPFDGSTANATGADVTVAGANDFADMWHIFDPNQQPGATGDYTISLCGSSFDTTLAVFDAQMTELAFNDDYCSAQSQLDVTGLQKGQKYYIRVAGVNGAKGSYTLSIDGPAPQCANRPVSDINNDCLVNFSDLAVMASEWLDCGYDLPQGCAN